MRARLWLASCVAVFAAGAVSVLLAAFGTRQPSNVSGPDEWVAFEAEFTTKSQGAGDTVTHGRLFRSSDGSERRETFAPGLADPHIVIFSVQKRMAYYLRPPKDSWEARPIIFPKAGYKPTKQLSLDSVSLQPQTARVINGFTVWEKTARQPEGDVLRQLIAPDLNFRPLQSYGAGRVEELTNIVIGEPDVARFSPPAGATVVTVLNPVRLGRFTAEELALRKD